MDITSQPTEKAPKKELKLKAAPEKVPLSKVGQLVLEKAGVEFVAAVETWALKLAGIHSRLMFPWVYVY